MPGWPWLLDSERVKRQALVTQYELIGYQGAADSRAMAHISSASGERGEAERRRVRVRIEKKSPPRPELFLGHTRGHS